MDSTNITRRLKEFGGWLKQSYLIKILFCLAILFCFVKVQSYYDERRIEKQTEQLQKLDQETERSKQQTQKLYEVFNQQHQQTVLILDAVKEISDSMTKLVENDRRQDLEVNNLKDVYKNARNPNNQSKTNITNRNNRNNLPLRTREEDLLSTDAKLYPNSGN